MQSERGFTLIELLTSMAIIGILAATMASSFKLYQKDAYDTHAIATINDGAISIEAGINGMLDDRGFYAAWADTATGNIMGTDVNKMMPGMKMSPNIRMWSGLDMACAAGTRCPSNVMCCAEAWITAFHCKGEKAHQWTRFNNGLVVRQEFPGFGGC